MARNFGVHIPGHKELTSQEKIKVAKIPDKVYIPLCQHLGAPAEPIVKVGDKVKLGQKIAESKSYVSAPIHASVSGTVLAIKKMTHSVLGYGDCIVIENDGLEEKDTTLKELFQVNPEKLTADELRTIVLEAGIVGLGGATFPTHVKYKPPEGTTIDYILLNGGECEPYLTSDFRVMVENADRIVKGLQYIMKIVGCDKGVVGIEDNKPEAIDILTKASAEFSNIEVKVCPERYPQGSEKHLIYSCLGRIVPSGKLPLDIGVIVNNVGTAIAVADAIEYGIPLIKRVVTVSGQGVQNPGNYLVRIGTLFSDLIEELLVKTGKVTSVTYMKVLKEETILAGQCIFRS
jgi:electron transport complex protein RnfC